MPITLPESYRERLEPFARQSGATVDDYVTTLLEDWLSWKEAEPELAKALDGRPAESWNAQDFEAVRQRVKDQYPEAFRE